MVLERWKNVNEGKCHKERKKYFSQVATDITAEKKTGRIWSYVDKMQGILRHLLIIKEYYAIKQHNSANLKQRPMLTCVAIYFELNDPAWGNLWIQFKKTPQKNSCAGLKIVIFDTTIFNHQEKIKIKIKKGKIKQSLQ